MFKSCSRHIGYSLCERSSVVEHHLAKVGVAGSNPVVRLLEAGVAELADAQDLKSCGTYTPVSVRFRSPAYFKEFVGIAQLDRAFGYGPKGREFESSHPRFGVKP